MAEEQLLSQSGSTNDNKALHAVRFAACELRVPSLASLGMKYLVAAESSRRGLIATTFTGNVPHYLITSLPHYDIIVSHEEGKHVSVQVKASTTVCVHKKGTPCIRQFRKSSSNPTRINGPLLMEI